MYPDEFDDGDALKGVLCFSEFRDFYRNEIATRKDRISVKWYVNSDIWHNSHCYAYQGYNKITNQDCIILEWPPVTANDAFLVAHELCHVIRKSEGLSLKIEVKHITDNMSDDLGQNLSIRLGSMFDDPLVDSFLERKYGFNRANHYVDYELPDAIDELKQAPRKIENDTIRLMHILFYSTQLLKWDQITDANALNKWLAYQRIFKSKYKSIARSGEELYFIIKEVGYDTIDKQRIVFDRMAEMYIIDGNKLGEILSIE